MAKTFLVIAILTFAFVAKVQGAKRCRCSRMFDRVCGDDGCTYDNEQCAESVSFLGVGEGVGNYDKYL